MAQTAKSLTTIQETWVQSLGQDNPLEKEMATYSSILAWRMDRGAWRATVHRITKSQTKTEQPTLILIKKNKIGLFVEMWMDLETLI